ncbi:MAG: DUF2946 domain-containing protein [Burkholderiales bacterium]|jgi:hypothetical protein|nr:DUF2946 domain-containing protein [Burkholderiales bacterium]
MSLLRGRRTFSSWIALLAILVVTLAPSVTGMLSASSGQLWDQVCSATSPVVTTKSTSGDPSPAAPHAFEHCPYCALHADLAPPPDPRQAGAGVAFAFQAVPAAFVHAPRARATWTSAQPRAPPLAA